MKKAVTMVFFGGSWGNDPKAAEQFWFKFVERWIRETLAPQLRAHGVSISIRKIFPEGSTTAEYTDSALQALQYTPDNTAVAVCYSAGTDLARCVAMQRPRLFRGALFLGGLPAGGLPWMPFLRALWYGWYPFLRGFVTGQVDISKSNCVEAYFGRGAQPETVARMRSVLRPEPMRVLLARTPLRFLVGVAKPRPLPCRVVAVTGTWDFFVDGSVRYPSEDPRRIFVPEVGHGILTDPEKITSGLALALPNLVSMILPPDLSS